MNDDLIYLYAVTDSPVALAETRTLAVRSLFATVADVPASEFSTDALQKNFRNFAWVEHYARKHERIIDSLMQASTVLPCRFPTLFYSESAAVAFIEQNYEALFALTQKLRGKEEWGIKLYSHPELFRQAVLNDPAICALDSEIAQASAGKAFLLKKRRQEVLAELLSLRQHATTQQVLQRLQPFAVELKVNPPLPREVTERDDEMILNAALLIDSSQTSFFLEEVHRLKSELSAKGLTLEHSGAWAAYNFCTFPKSTQKLQS
jgi:hypothetical protein